MFSLAKVELTYLLTYLSLPAAKVSGLPSVCCLVLGSMCKRHFAGGYFGCFGGAPFSLLKTKSRSTYDLSNGYYITLGHASPVCSVPESNSCYVAEN